MDNQWMGGTMDNQWMGGCGMENGLMGELWTINGCTMEKWIDG
jgi:hypothetical protein